MWLSLLLIACTSSKPAAESATESPDEPLSLPIPDNGYQLITPTYEVPAFSEIEICTVMRLEPHEDEKLYWVNGLESLVTEGTHHMNVLIGEFSFLDAFVGDGSSEAALGVPVGQYRVEIRSYDPNTPLPKTPRDPQRKQLLPAKYNVQSELEFAVEAGQDKITQDFDLLN